MKPDFALLLSFDGIALLRRASADGAAGDGWRQLGVVSPELPDLSETLIALRERVTKGDCEVKLILPTEQVKFLDIAAPAPGISNPEAVEAALDGATPYAIDDLVYDFHRDGDHIHVAAVARETLDEAEQFAILHGFLPLGFVSDVAKDAGFQREPFFGPTQKALTTLTPGMTVQGDDTPVAILDDLAEPVPPVQEKTAPETPRAKPEASAPKSDTPAPPKAKAAPTAPKERPTEERPVKAKPDARTPAPAPQPATPKPASAPTAKPPPQPEGQAAGKTPAAPKPDAARGTDTSPKTPEVKAAPPPPPALKPEADVPPLPSFKKQQRPGPVEDAGNRKDPPAVPVANPNAPPPPGPKVPPSVSAMPPEPATPGFSSIRANRDAPAPRASKNLTARPENLRGPASDTPVSPPKPRDVADEIAASARASFTMRPKPKADNDGDSDNIGDQIAATAPTATAPTAEPTPSTASGIIARASAGIGKNIGFASRRTGAAQSPAKPAKPSRKARLSKVKPGDAKAAETAAAAAVLDEGDRMTVFGARGQQKIGGKPRFLGLMLTAALILALLAVSAWASLFLDDGLASLFRRNVEGPAVASATAPAVRDSALDTTDPDSAAAPPEAIPPTALALPDLPREIDPEDPTDINIASLSEGLPSLSRDLVEEQVDGLSVPFESEALTPEQAEARYAATGIWQRAPMPPNEPEQALVGELYVASIDPNVAVGDAIAIPTQREADTDQIPPTQINPYPADSGFTFDDNGLIQPTAQGVLHPAGFTLVLGPPPLKAPLRPGVESVTPAALPAPETGQDPQSSDPASDDENAALAAAIAAASAAVPVPAPIPGATPAPDTSAPTTAADPSLAGLRPRPRPGDLIEQNERANLGGISLEELRQKRPKLRPAQDPAKTEAEKDIEASELAVASSLKPNRRPTNMATLVDRAAQNAANSVVAAAAPAAVAPRTVTPRIPSKTTVATAATQKNAINLRNVNLIGVYGKPSSRRALIRLSNGRYQKVKVGDRIDGGRVSAIDEDRLNYVKSGRNVVLRMPRG